MARHPAPHALWDRCIRCGRQDRLQPSLAAEPRRTFPRFDPARPVYQDTRGRHGSEGEDRAYADDAADGFDTLDWIAAQPWTNQLVGMSGSSAGATTTFAAASTRHPSLRAFFAQAGASSIYDDVVYEGQSI
jgi:predicted acyl esterase